MLITEAKYRLVCVLCALLALLLVASLTGNAIQRYQRNAAEIALSKADQKQFELGQKVSACKTRLMELTTAADEARKRRQAAERESLTEIKNLEGKLARLKSAPRESCQDAQEVLNIFNQGRQP